MNPGKIGGYEILSELGRGAMGVVYHARDAAIGRAVAIKVIRIDAGTSAEEGAHLRQRLIREAGAAGKMYHPGIVTVHQLGEDGTNVFVVMEYVEGSSLERLLINNPLLDRAWALDILAQVAVALDYAHREGVVHRDVKPANILVRPDRRVKIADFGIAKITAGATTGMTGAGISIGSPAYMSPEQIQAKPVDGRSDQFALASIAFQMLTGRLPFRGDTAHTVMFQIVMANPFEPQPGDAPLSPNVRAVLARALAKNPDERFPDCASFIQDLNVASGVETPAPQISTTRIEALQSAPPPKESRSWMALPAIGGFLTLALAGGGIYWYMHQGSNVPAPIRTPVAAPVANQAPAPTPAAPEPAAKAAPIQVAEDKKPTAAPKKPPAIAAGKETLISAVTYGKLDAVKSLLANGANINEKDRDGATPLMIAAGGTEYLPNNLPMVEMLVAARASLEKRDSEGRTALDRAVAEGKTEVVGFLLNSGALDNARANDGSTPMLYAAKFGKLPVLKLLIAHHAQVDLADASGATPLMIASEGNANLPNNTPMVEALLNAGARVDIVDARGRSALHRASAEAKPEAVRLLLDNHAKPNLRASDGSTALIEAVTFSRPLVAQILLTHGADANLADAKGTTPLMIAAETSPYIKDPAHFIKLLLAHGAKRGLKDNQGRTALQRAVESKNTVAMELLK